MSISKTVLLSTVFSFATYGMIVNTYAIPHNDPDASHDQLVSFASPPHSPKTDDQEFAESNGVNLSPSHTNTNIEALSARLNLKEGDQYAITGNDRAQLFMQRANAYEKEGALVFALKDLNTAVRLNRDLHITGEFIIKVTKLWEEMAKQIRIGQIDPAFPRFTRDDNIYATCIRSYKIVLSNVMNSLHPSRSSKAYALMGLACGIVENIDRFVLSDVIEPLSQALELQDESGQFILQGRDRAKALMTWGVTLSDAYPLIFNHLRKPANQKLTEACDMVDDNHQPLLEPSDYIEALVKRGTNLRALKKLDEAINDFEKALSVYSETPISKRPLETREADMHFSLAEIYCEKENFSDALTHFKRAFTSKTLTRIYKTENMQDYMNLIREDGNFLLRGEDKVQALLIIANNARLERDFLTYASFSQQAFELLSEMPNPSQDLFRWTRALKTYAESKQGNPSASIDVEDHRPLSLLERLARIPQELDRNSAFENLLEDPEIRILGRASVLAERAEFFIRTGSWEAALRDLTDALVEIYKQGPKTNAKVALAYDKLFAYIPYEIRKESHFSIIRRQWPIFLLNDLDAKTAQAELATVHRVKPRQVLPLPSQGAGDRPPLTPQTPQKIQPQPAIHQQPQPLTAPKAPVLPKKTPAGAVFSKAVPVQQFHPSTAPRILKEENERLRKELEELKRNSQQIDSKDSGAKRQRLDKRDPEI